DAQAEVAAERGLAIVPPTVMAAFVLEQAETVGKAEIGDGLECSAFRWRAQDPIAPGHRVMDVAVVRRDVEVAQYHQARMPLQLAGNELAHPGQPVQLV